MQVGSAVGYLALELLAAVDNPADHRPEFSEQNAHLDRIPPVDERVHGWRGAAPEPVVVFAIWTLVSAVLAWRFLSGVNAPHRSVGVLVEVSR